MSNVQVITDNEQTTQGREGSDRGFSLVEVLIAIALMGIAVVPILLAGAMSVKASAQSRSAAKVETVLANAADRVNRAEPGCDYTIYVQAAALAAGWDAAKASATYQWYQPAALPTQLGTWNSGACPTGVYAEGLVQKVAITVQSLDGRVTRSLTVVKSDV